MSFPIPQGSTRLGSARHPIDNQPGTVIRFPNGCECLWCAGALRSLPKNWRESQSSKPDPEARVLDNSIK